MHFRHMTVRRWAKVLTGGPSVRLRAAPMCGASRLVPACGEEGRPFVHVQSQEASQSTCSMPQWSCRSWLDDLLTSDVKLMSFVDEGVACRC